MQRAIERALDGEEDMGKKERDGPDMWYPNVRHSQHVISMPHKEFKVGYRDLDLNCTD